jgi:hypothetical protein
MWVVALGLIAALVGAPGLAWGQAPGGGAQVPRPGASKIQPGPTAPARPPQVSPAPRHSPRRDDGDWDRHRPPPRPTPHWPTPWYGRYHPYPYPYGYPYYPPAPLSPTWVPGHWEWNGWQWVWQPGYWSYY